MLAALVWLVLAQPGQGLTIDFTQKDQARKWRPAHDIQALEPTGDGLLVRVRGDDPYLFGPRITPPGGNQPLLGTIRLKSTTGGTGQVFYFTDLNGTTERNSVRFEVPAGEWHTARIRLPALPWGTRFRLDPPGNGDCTFASIHLEARKDIQPPDWPPLPPDATPGDLPHHLSSGKTSLRVGKGWDHWQLEQGGRLLARGHRAGLIGHQIMRQGKPELEWMPLAPELFDTQKDPQGNLVTRGTWRDSDGCTWTLERKYNPGREGSLHFSTRLTVDQPRKLVWLPALMAVAGARKSDGSLDPDKSQALLAGVEYLDNEPSSSQADITGPAHQRRVPDPVKLTMPLMAWQRGNQWLAVSWKENAYWAPLFDTPDRTLKTGGHLLGLILPGADPGIRGDGDLFPFAGIPLPTNQDILLEATVSAGTGDNLTSAIRHHLGQNPPPVLADKPTLADYVELATLGWLESGLAGEPGTFRHAVMGNLMGPQPASDAAWMLEWLAANQPEKPLGKRASESSAQAWSRVAPAGRFHSMVGHLREPVALFLGEPTDLKAGMEQASGRFNQLLGRFEKDGVIRYRGNHPADLARTQNSREANGLAGRVVVDLLQAASVSGEAALLENALAKLDSLTRYRNTVPRGAQTWEVPLHTPDILASAHLVEAYRLAHELTGNRQYLEQAIEWAWTGVPFVYLRNPAGGPVGEYATIAVLGATHYEAPVWIGLPVQWCGLVYADAIGRLARHDPSGPWKQLASGITLSAMRQVYPKGTARQGLLPDSFSLRSQIRNPADINPGTLLPLAMRLLADAWTYDTVGVPGTEGKAWLVGPGKFQLSGSLGNQIEITFSPWRKAKPSLVLFGGEGWKGLNIQASEESQSPGVIPNSESRVAEVRGTARWQLTRQAPN